MGRHGRNEGKNRGKVQINLETPFVCYVEMIIYWVFVAIILREMLLIERGALSVHSSFFNNQSPLFISNLRYRLPSSYACARVLQGFCIFCCHKCHTDLFQTSVFHLQVSRCFSENHTSFWWKPHVVLMKTTRRLLWGSAHFATSWAKMCNECYNMGLTNLRTEGYVTTCDTCDSKKCKIPVGCARAHAWKGVI